MLSLIAEKDGTISLPSDELALSGGDCPIDLDQIVAQMGNCGNDASGMIDLTKENVLTGSCKNCYLLKILAHCLSYFYSKRHD